MDYTPIIEKLARQVRPASGLGTPVLAGVYDVPSLTRSGTYHRVVFYQDGTVACGCEYNTFKGGVCKHIQAACSWRVNNGDHSVVKRGNPRSPAPQADPDAGPLDRLRIANREVEAAAQAFTAAQIRLEAAVKAQTDALLGAVGRVK